MDAETRQPAIMVIAGLHSKFVLLGHTYTYAGARTRTHAHTRRFIGTEGGPRDGRHFTVQYVVQLDSLCRKLSSVL